MEYVHLTTIERESILRFISQGLSVRATAAKLGRSPATVSRELSRNASPDSPYSPSEATVRYALRRQACRAPLKLADESLQELFHARLSEGWSPEQVVGRLARERGGEAGISVTTVYRAFDRGLLFHGSKKCLRRKGRRYRMAGARKGDGRGHIRNAVSISMRPKEVERRDVIGHWEGDTVLGRPGSGGVVTLVERKSRYVLIRKIPDKTSGATLAAIVSLFGGLDERALQTLTVDNGKEFAWHEKMSAELGGLPIYFAHPSRPCERGTDENTNGLIREYLPKGTDFRKVSHKEVRAIQDRLNARPRRCLGFLSPNEALRSSLLHLG